MQCVYVHYVSALVGAATSVQALINHTTLQKINDKIKQVVVLKVYAQSPGISPHVFATPFRLPCCITKYLKKARFCAALRV